ncbi:unnamed protein product [Orchesella dallaii]
MEFPFCPLYRHRQRGGRSRGRGRGRAKSNASSRGGIVSRDRGRPNNRGVNQRSISSPTQEGMTRSTPTAAENVNVQPMSLHPLLIEEVVENVMKYLPSQNLKITRQVCVTWFHATRRLWGQRTKIRLRTAEDVHRFVSDFEMVKGANRANHFPLPFLTRQWVIDRADHIYKFPKDFFDVFGKYVHKLVLMEPEYIGGSWTPYPVDDEDRHHYGGLFYSPIATDEILEILSRKMPNLKDLIVKFRPTAGELSREYIFIYGLNPAAMGVMVNLRSLSVREHIRIGILDEEEWELSNEIRDRRRLEEMTIPEERFLHAMLHNAPNLETLKIRVNTVRKEMVLSSLIFDESVHLPKLKHLPCPISISTQILEKMRQKPLGLVTLSLKLGIFSESVNLKDINKMLQTYKGTLENLKLIVWTEKFQHQLPVAFSQKMTNVKTLELWGFHSHGSITEAKKFPFLKRLMLGIPLGRPDGIRNEVLQILPDLDTLHVEYGFNSVRDSENWHFLPFV